MPERDGKSTTDMIEDFLSSLDGYSALSELPPAPAGLIRRFPFTNDPNHVIPVGRLPPDLQVRVELADIAKFDFYRLYMACRYYEETARAPTIEEVQSTFIQSQRVVRESYPEYATGEYDLHDVYRCVEAGLVNLYEAKRYNQRVGDAIQDWEGVLEGLGATIDAETSAM